VRAFDARDYNRRIDAQVFFYWRCGKCGVIFLHPAPADLARYYPDDYYVLARSRAELATWSLHEAYKLDIVSGVRAGGRLIEVGPASGAFAFLAQRAGYQVTAIEMDRRCCEYLSSQLGIEAIHSAEEANALAEMPPADVIAMWHVIEHLADPWAMLEVAAARLRPGGVLVLATPNPHALQFRLFGNRWTHVDAPRHLWLIPPEVLVRRGAALGLSARLQTTRDRGSLSWNRFGWEWSLAAAGMPRGAARWLGGIATVVAAPLESREGRGCAYTLVLQKGGA
jgi:SAM-dependent methyltransferase